MCIKCLVSLPCFRQLIISRVADRYVSLDRAGCFEAVWRHATCDEYATVFALMTSSTIELRGNYVTIDVMDSSQSSARYATYE